MKPTSILQDAIGSNNPAGIESSLSECSATNRQDELNASLVQAMPHGSLETIQLLLTLGAKLKSTSFYSAIAREDAAMLQLLIDFGWDIDSTEFELSAIQ
jgi:hypothetical protein